MHGYVNIANLKNSKVGFDKAECLVDQDFRLPTLSEMISECRRTGQMPYSNVRPVAPTETDDINSSSYGASDRIDAYIQQEARAIEIESLEKKRDEQRFSFTKQRNESSSAPDDSSAGVVAD